VRGFNLGCVPGFLTWESIQEKIDLPFLYKMFDLLELIYRASLLMWWMVLLFGILRVIYAIIEDDLYIEQDHIV
jgi:hypothetical protein